MKKLVSSVLAASMVLSLAACGSSASTDTASSSEAVSTSTAATTEAAGEGSGTYTGPPIKIGGIGPLTGENATYGVAVMNGAQIAVDEINAAGGINGTIPINLVSVDDEGVPATSVTAMQKLVEQDKVNAVIGARHHRPGHLRLRPGLHRPRLCPDPQRLLARRRHR